jgi:RimJ/RimL family protein N-acetyltransferase
VNSIESSLNLLQRWVTKATLQSNGTGLWAIIIKETGEIVGMIGLIQLQDEDENLTQDYEIGWHLKKSAWGKGYATEAAKAILDYGFEVLKLTTIYAVARPENTASLRLIQRLGMIPIGRTTRYYKTELEMFKLEANFAINC